MNYILYKIVENKKKIIIAIILVIIMIFLCRFVFKVLENKKNNIDVSNAIHGVIIEDETAFYKKPKESKWKLIRNLKKGQYAYIVEEVTDKKSVQWYKIKADDKVGYVKKENVAYYEFSKNNRRTLMSDVSKFNVIYKDFTTSGEYAAFLAKCNINYAYIRAGGRGYGDEGNFYTDPNFKIFIEACEYLGVPYGIYYIDEALNSEEIDEEVEFITQFLKENKTKNCVLPLALDIESHDGVGRADDIWEERGLLAQELVDKFKSQGIETIIYSNAKTASEYLYYVDTKFWIAYYDLKKEVPDYWFTKTEHEAVENEELMNKTIAWQFTEDGAGKEIEYPVDISIVDNNFFKTFVK